MTSPQSTDDLSHVRPNIDAADVKIGKALLSVEFALRANPSNDVANDDISNEARQALEDRFVPLDLITTVAKYIDLSKLNKEQKEALFIALAEPLADRYEAVLDVAAVKKKHGETSAYHAKRHQDVIDNYKAFAGENIKLANIFGAIGKDIADKMTEYQNVYLNEEADFSAPADTYREKNPIAYTEARKMRAAIHAL